MELKFRSWWRPSRKASELHDDRTVSFLELFYDLVYVVLVAELAHALAAHLDLKHIGQFVFLFAIVWWSWLNGTWYYEFHGNNDIRTRVFTFLQMFAVAGMAVFAHNALAEGSVGFALFYGFYQLILCYLWWRLSVHDPEHHIENRSYVIFFSISTALFFVSALIPTPSRFYIWVVAVLISLLQPFLQTVFRMRNNDSNTPFNFSISHAFVERFGLFTILVLAEAIVGVVQGLTHHDHLYASVFITGGLGLCLAFVLWWLFFDFVSHRPPVTTGAHPVIWMYMHLFATMSIVAIGAATLNIVEHAGEGLEPTVRWLLVSAIAIFLTSLFVLMRVIQVNENLKSAYITASIMVLLGAIVIACLGLTNLATIPLLVIILALMIAPVVYAIILWVSVFDAKEIQHH